MLLFEDVPGPEFPPELPLSEQFKVMKEYERARKPYNTGRIADNIISDYGKDRFNELIKALQKGISGEVIGRSFGISRQRVSQWRSALGRSRFEPFSETVKRLPPTMRRSTTLI